MKCHKFNISRSFATKFSRITKSHKKLIYTISTNRSRLLDSGYFESQTWGALHKAWKGFVIAKNNQEFEIQYYYAEVIQKLQKELGIRITSFPDLGLIPKNPTYIPSEEFDREMQEEQNHNPSEEFDREMQEEQNS